MIRRPPRSTLSSSSAASDVYKRQIAPSAPIGCMDPNFKGDTYWKVVTHDATAAGGSQPQCAQVVFDTLTAIKAAIPTSDTSRADLERELKLCGPVQSTDGELMMLFLQAAFDALAMGNYPYPTNYIAGTPERPAPAWPMRKACDYLQPGQPWILSLIHISEPTRLLSISYAVFCLKKKKKTKTTQHNKSKYTSRHI
eukprot:TRINITY_DN29786_c0_g1_i2.p1 TRINITY_DN29786_c0_g1~~TRINITY_DN29786_c0_g1_i2.p1  ORF type:complete len:197 (+),score=58.90 TRINITY_DN29786_c0_g1_i2:111-701(+)